MHPTVDFDSLKGDILKNIRHLNTNTKDINDMKKRIGSKSVSKDVKLSETARARGNKLYLSNSFKPIDRSYHLYQTLHIYNESIAYSSIGSQEIALAYANRSAILRRMHRYKECIAEADKALSLIESHQLKIKLLCRKAECLTALGLSGGRDNLEEAKSLHNQVQGSSEMKKMLFNLIKKARQARFGRDDKGSDDEYLNEEPREDKRVQDSLKLVKEAEKIPITNSIKVEFSRIYGRNLVAARSFKPGEIIVVEEPYHSQIHYSIAYKYCYHCMKYLWTVIPCDHCTWRLFCSEKCKIDSWSKYHDLECSVISHLRVVLELEKNPFIPFLISVFSKALKEAGSIDQLQAELESLKIESLDAPLTSYKSIFASPTRNLDEDESASCSYNSVLALIALAKYTSVFGTSYDFDDLGKLAKNKSAIFVGAFILKISLIIASKCISFRLYDPGMSATLSAQLDEALKDEAAWVRKRNMSLNPISMLSLVGCIPNFGTSLTHGGKVAVWAIQPIKPGDQLIAYLPPTVYDFSNKIVRQPRSWLYFDKECDCQACKENWSEIIRKPITSRGKLWKEMWSILLSWQRNSGALDYPNIEYVTRCKNLASEIWKEYPMPSAMYVAMMRIMHRVFMIFFTPSEIVASRKGLHQIECFLPEEEQLPDSNVNSSS